MTKLPRNVLKSVNNLVIDKKAKTTAKTLQIRASAKEYSL